MRGEIADGYAAVAAAYVHIPFCSMVCPYCDFAVVAGADDLTDRYVEAVCREIVRSDPWRSLGAVYFGGGTPSRVDPRSLGRILEALDLVHGIRSDAELSIEANPEDFHAAKAMSLRGLGFNRVSFGAQSFDPEVLSYLGRRHRSDDISSAVGAARSAGIERISLDLIYGSPCESASSWNDSLNAAVDLDPGHVSAYALTVEAGTPLAKEVRGGAPAPDPDLQADRYGAAEDILGGAGLARYEVSNWAIPGDECIYNMVVWAQGEYLGFGNGAHGHLNGRRVRNSRRIGTYLDAIASGRSPRAGSESVSGWDAELDRLFVGVRRTVGVAAGPGVTALLGSFEVSRLLDASVVALGEGRLVVKNPLLTDMVQRTVLGLPHPRGWAQRDHRDIVLVADA